MNETHEQGLFDDIGLQIKLVDNLTMDCYETINSLSVRHTEWNYVEKVYEELMTLISKRMQLHEMRRRLKFLSMDVAAADRRVHSLKRKIDE